MVHCDKCNRDAIEWMTADPEEYYKHVIAEVNLMFEREREALAYRRAVEHERKRQNSWRARIKKWLMPLI